MYTNLYTCIPKLSKSVMNLFTLLALGCPLVVSVGAGLSLKSGTTAGISFSIMCLILS